MTPPRSSECSCNTSSNAAHSGPSDARVGGAISCLGSLSLVEIERTHVRRSLSRARDRNQVATDLGGAKAVPRHRRTRPPEVLLPRDVSVSLRSHPHGPCACLRDRR